jgi:hypothetical protein
MQISKLIKLSGSDKERCKLLDYFNKSVKEKNLVLVLKQMRPENI